MFPTTALSGAVYIYIERERERDDLAVSTFGNGLVYMKKERKRSS